MVKRMLMDATHPEETRVVVLDGTRLEEFDVETSTKKQIKGNIYLAKVIRVEPSLQAAFVDYGGNRHGFLAFNEIHPDYYQIPVSDRERLMAEAQRHHDEDHDDEPKHVQSQPAAETSVEHAQPAAPDQSYSEAGAANADDHHDDAHEDHHGIDPSVMPLAFDAPSVSDDTPASDSENEAAEPAEEEVRADNVVDAPIPEPLPETSDAAPAAENAAPEAGETVQRTPEKSSGVETVGGEDDEDDEDEGTDDDKQRRRFVASRHYKIQEVIKRRQIMLVQVVKEERGNKGAALTTYLSLAGRYCVLMPNSGRGGGVSRKITSVQDRRRLKTIMSDLELPKNMAVILRTAGSERSKAEIKRDYEYLQRTWNSIREGTMRSRAPALIHEEASLIKRAIRDIYSRDIEEVFVEGEEGYKVAKDFMKMLTPSHAKKVQRYKDDLIPLFHRYQVESQMEAINSPVIQLRSGGSIVFNQTEALVAIDVNSGRATRERHIEETAYKTNIEAADEVARQLRLRDLAGLIVIDFIDMEDNRNNHAVERRLKEALKADRARIQVGRISHFGLLELSRQRLRPSLIETNFRVCSHCAGTGLIRSKESAAIHTLRMIEEEGVRRRSSELTVTVNDEVALYLLNYKRDMLASVEARYGIKILVFGDEHLIPPNLRIDRIKAMRLPGAPEHVMEIEPARAIEPPPAPEEDDDAGTEDEEEVRPERSHRSEGRNDGRNASRGEGPRDDHRRDEGEEGGRKRRRRRRRRGGGENRDHAGPSQGHGQHADQNQPPRHTAPVDGFSGEAVQAVDGQSEPSGEHQSEHQGEQDGGQRDEQGVRRRRRGRRGGRRRRRERGENPGENQGANGSQGEGEFAGGPEDTGGAFEGDHQTPQDTTAIAEGENAGSSEAPSAPARFFRALKEGAKSWRGGRENDPTPDTEPAPVPVQEPTPPPPPIYDPPPSEPAGPPKKGWWNKDQP